MIDGREVVGSYEVVRTYTVVEHRDIVAPPEPDPYEGLLVFYDYQRIYNWAYGVREGYTTLMSEWSAAIEEYAGECAVIQETFEKRLGDLYTARGRLRRKKERRMLEYVVDNTYFHGARVESAIPEVRRFMEENFEPRGNSIVSMFSLQVLTLQQDHATTSPAFSFDFNEDEVVQWFRSMDQ